MELEHRVGVFELCAFTKRIEQSLADADWLLANKPEGVNLERVEVMRDRLKAGK